MIDSITQLQVEPRCGCSQEGKCCGWSPAEIRSALPKGAQARVMRRTGASQAQVANVVAKRTRSRRIEGAIAQILQVPRELIFGPNRNVGRPRVKKVASVEVER